MNTAEPSPTWARKRSWYTVLVICVIGLGLASRSFPNLFPAALGKYPGDALWALMVFLGWGVIFPRASTIHTGAGALATSFAVEFFKLCHPAWIHGFKATTLGHLILGDTFSWQNLVAYTGGVVIGVFGERYVRARATK